MIGPMDASLVAVRGLDVRFGPRAALAGIDLDVAPGHVHGLLGPSGAGKSVLLRVLAGTQEPHAGSVAVFEPGALVSEAHPVVLASVEADLAPGERLRNALARAVAADPAVLLVDEPQGGFDPETAAAARALVTRHVLRGGAC